MSSSIVSGLERLVAAVPRVRQVSPGLATPLRGGRLFARGSLRGDESSSSSAPFASKVVFTTRRLASKARNVIPKIPPRAAFNDDEGGATAGVEVIDREKMEKSDGVVDAPPPLPSAQYSPTPPDLDAIMEAAAEFKINLPPSIASVADKVKTEVKKLRAKGRELTYPPLPVVQTFDELLRFAHVAALNGAPKETIEAFFDKSGEDVVVIELESVKQKLFIATNHASKTHTISFRGTTNLTNVVQNIRLSSNPVRASGRLASVGRSLSGAFAGLPSMPRLGIGGIGVPGRSDESDKDGDGSGSFDEDDDDEVCANIDFDAPDGEYALRGCTDHLPMHRGYRIVARACRDALASYVVPGYDVQLTGHSLGGAVAVAVALLYQSAGVNVVKVVTFGAPKLGPRETREAAETLNILRVVQKDDIIPLLPMSRPFVRKPYVHLGEGVMLDNDTPGRYANLTNEWGTAGILWRQQAHLGYASGKMDRAAVAVEEDRGGGGLGRGRDVDVLVSADDADAAIGSVGGVGTGIGEEREGRWASARKRLASLRANLREGIATRVARAGEVVVAATPGVGVGGVVAAASASVAAKSGDASAAANAFNLQALPMSENEWAAEVAEWAHAPHENSAATSASLSTSDPAPFDDVEGELFVRLAETEGGAGAAAAAAATEWEKATSRADAAESDASVSAVAAVAAANNIVAASDQSANDRAGPTIFQALWRLRSQPAMERTDRLESHRMRRYVKAIEAAMEAGPVQTSLRGVYTGQLEDDVGLDMEEDDGDGGLASWMSWSR